MSKIFLDTNILISAIVFDKKELELIIRCVDDSDILYISEHIFEEAMRVFLKKFPEHVEFFKKFIEISNIKIIKKKVYEQSIKNFQNIRDKYDAYVIAAAKANKCNYIITGDKDILNYDLSKIKIIKPSELIEIKKQK
ncbi:MAG: putative toxin-antitoxin system toxin component, PIN family [Candidatus Thorarchaeota archaeon]